MDDDKKMPVAGTFAKLMASGPVEKKPADQEPTPQAAQEEPPVTKQASKKENHMASHIASNMTTNITSNIDILQLFSDKDIDDLKEPAYMAQTYRLREADVEWAKDTAHKLSKEFKRRKISQTDIVRISFKLFEKVLASNKAGLHALLEQIK
jgi:hypothetical protein